MGWDGRSVLETRERTGQDSGEKVGIGRLARSFSFSSLGASDVSQEEGRKGRTGERARTAIVSNLVSYYSQ
jgi:hypothetical protein